MHRRSLPLLLALTAGCAHVAPSGESQPAPASPATPIGPQLRAVADRIIALRGLPERSPLRMQVLAPAEFATEVKRLLAAARTRERAERSHALLLAFGLIEPSVDPAKVAQEVLQEQVAGLYDPVTRTLFVRSEPPPSAASAATTAGLDSQAVADAMVGHEVVHALQDQAYGVPTVAKLGLEGEQLLGAMAAFEGDATLAMSLLVANSPPSPEQLLRNLRTVQRLPREKLVKLSGQSPKLLRAPPLYLAIMLFPYIDGLRLAAELYAVGGFAAVNQMLQRPPVSSEQVLHPEKYVAGEQPVPVEAPGALSGYRVLARDSLGELGVRVLLSSCLGATPAPAGEGWGGDAATVLEGPDRSLALLWRTVWDSVAAAESFERSLRLDVARGERGDDQDGKGCWRDSGPITTPRAHWAVTGRPVIERKGTVVTVARGLPAELAGEEARRLASLPAPPAPAPVPPVGVMTLVPLGPRHPSTAANGWWKNPGYGLAAPLLPGYKAVVDAEAGQLMMASPEGMVVVRVDEMGRMSAATLAGVVSGLLHSGTDLALTEVGGGESTTAGVKSLYRDFRMGEAGHARVTILPLCGVGGLVSIFQMAKSPAAHERMSAWLEAMRRDEKSSFCPGAP